MLESIGPLPFMHLRCCTRWQLSDTYYEIFHDMLPWSQLTVLVIQGIGTDQCIKILILAPLLVYCDLYLDAGNTEDKTSRHIGLAHMKHFKLRGQTPLLNPLSILWLPALQRLQIDEACLRPNPVTALRSLLSHWGSGPHEIRIGFPSRPIGRYTAALPSVVFTSTSQPAVGLGFLDLRSTNLGIEAASIDEEGDWEEASSSEDEEFDEQADDTGDGSE
ncbi:hypothetical protein B0H16DRAFT_1389035 [Mycena metata]|uniref:Uncharacterized protein n=1 Tax=Mycena metata TaxID=1033252 RepID=A0AAD7MGV9_9AGAR|nr:hypothetical protein B0H16DRAFT_1389035 [Mycena metata]